MRFFLTIDLLQKILASVNLPLVFRENFGKVYPQIIEAVNRMEHDLKTLKIRIDQLELENGGMKMQFFEMKAQNESLVNQFSEKDSKINFLKTNIENLTSTLSNMQNQYDSMAKNFREILFENDDTGFFFPFYYI